MSNFLPRNVSWLSNSISANRETWLTSDQACADLVIQAPILRNGNLLHQKHEHDDLCGCDKFKLTHPDTDWITGLKHAEKIGLGTTAYELITV